MRPPLVLGGTTTAALRDAAELGSGWYGFGHLPEEAARARTVICRGAERLDLRAPGRLGLL